jgi:hypothetical protein
VAIGRGRGRSAWRLRPIPVVTALAVVLNQFEQKAAKGAKKRKKRKD